MLVKWNGTNVWSIQSGKIDGSVIQLIPGPNQISKADWDAIKEHPVVKARMEKDVVVKGKMAKMLEVVMPKADESNEGSDEGQNNDGSEMTISNLNATNAVKLIKETYNVELLREWQESETRAKPGKAIETQIAKIEKEREEDEGNSDAVVE